MTMQKAVGIVVAVVLALGAGYYLFANYLVSKLDGTGGVTAPQEQDPQVAYSANGLGLSFKYPEKRYTLSTHQSGNDERKWDNIVLVPSDFTPVDGGEGAPSISILVLPNPEKLSLEQWIKGDARSNWKLSPDNAQLRPTTVGGEDGYAYIHGGLYETDAVAVAHGDTIYLFEVGWMNSDDGIRSDFAKLLETVQFN